jgi:membrane associated rhomboid family serine protease
MFPLRDVHKPARPPFVTRLLVTVNIATFAYQWALRLLTDTDLIASMGVKPKCFVMPGACGISVPGESAQLWQPLLVSMFLHGGLLHLAFNMLFLSVFGAGVEDRLGRFRFIMVYLGCGLAAALAHIATHPFSPAPAIGASGAIAGVLGVYLILLPRSWILTYLPPIFIFPVPAPLFLVIWIAGQLTSAFDGLSLFSPGQSGDNISWMAHIGGFAAGAAIGWAIKPWWKNKTTPARS